ncbi:hypothetical protein [Atlantibacter hermannii]|uniref:hypothetical protein n=1 Tax=Atlantibacter hermannii TaxID=565 RepID=UPI0028985925|nr:hypothetical protein [Atlantibacter hermannii]
MNKPLFLITCILLAGCASKPPASQVKPLAPATPQVAAQPQTPPTAAPPSSAASDNADTVAICRKELEALKLYGPNTYSRYAAEMDALTGKTAKYLSIKEGLTPELNSVVTTMYQSKVKTLCFRIHTSLGKLIIEQAGG